MGYLDRGYNNWKLFFKYDGGHNSKNSEYGKTLTCINKKYLLDLVLR